MGYCTTREGRLVCDGCASSAGVRKRVCPYRVTNASLRGEQRSSLPYCPPPALCSRCYKAEGGLRGVHASCKDRAAELQAGEDALQAELDAGESFAMSAFGSWAETVPAGKVGVAFYGRSGPSFWLVDEIAYQARGRHARLSDYPHRRPWAGHNGRTSRRVA